MTAARAGRLDQESAEFAIEDVAQRRVKRMIARTSRKRGAARRKAQHERDHRQPRRPTPEQRGAANARRWEQPGAGPCVEPARQTKPCTEEKSESGDEAHRCHAAGDANAGITVGLTTVSELQVDR